MGGSLSQHKKSSGVASCPRPKNSSISDSEGNFETPEAETPVHGHLKNLLEQENAAAVCTDLLGDDKRLFSSTVGLDNSFLDKNSNQNELPLASQAVHVAKGTPVLTEAVDALNNLQFSKGSSTIQGQNLNLQTRGMQLGLDNRHTDDLQEDARDTSQKQRPASLMMKDSLNGPDPNEVDDDVPISKAFDLNQINGNANPLVKPTPGDHMQELGLEDNANPEEVSKPSGRSLGKMPDSRLGPKKPTGKSAELEPGPVSSQGSGGITCPKASYNFDAGQLDDPNFNPFTNKAKMCDSPPLLKGSYSFDPDCVDPFRSSRRLDGEDLLKSPPSAEKVADDPVCQKLNFLIDEEGMAGQSQGKAREVMNANKGKNEQQPLVDICSQEKGPNVASRRVHATDEEKLASSVSGQNPGKTENGCCEEEDEPCKKRLAGKGMEVTTGGPEGADMYNGLDDPCKTKSAKLAGSESHDKGTPVLDKICLNEADKEAVLTLIREEIITKEIEANEWRRKHEESRQEVLEMRKIVAEYEKTVAQMIEDKQQAAVSSQSTIQQLTLEKEQALADLNSVERSLSDLFRRYENMKSVLEGFKKNEEVLKKCAQEYLTRVKQEEQRYQTLKIHAEEKLDKANEEIAQVRSKASSESMALHASLRKEQMKVESLERALHQKNQEIEELTKICDELIAKMGRPE
ncbi:transforming acidic coiled-coil-containing protein 1-like isoform X2 [Brienomyrus brachyistius]|uniref:transforming acidic coiled-coil-containing protein 1-like isoform X2 n=1 Tax=Brienomyrus brachyistius TaxID=42636 RepID=UPI0020B40AC4|nr:transforming acidic coiled-coil-containing protein 1-like isoform X2 [Brienomyrus brachyistius]